MASTSNAPPRKKLKIRAFARKPKVAADFIATTMASVSSLAVRQPSCSTD